MTNTKLQCTWRDGCNQLEACQAAECCQAVRSNREKAEQAPSNEKVPHGEIVYLPKITAEMVIDWNHPVELMKYEGGIQWTQDAVDFACLVAQHAYVEIGRLQTALQSSRDETARACQDYREALAENTKLKRAVSEPPAELRGNDLYQKKINECQAIWRTNMTLVCTLPKGHDGDHRADCGYTFNGEVDVRAAQPPAHVHTTGDTCDRLARLGCDVLRIHGVDISDQVEDLIQFYRDGGDAAQPPASAPMAPIAAIRVGEDDTCKVLRLYAPGLPPGEHDLYPAAPADCAGCEEFVRMQHDIASILGVDEDTDSISLHGRIYVALSARPSQPPAPEHQPIPATEIVAALERESANTDTDPRWMAAQCLRHIAGWESRTFMCRIDTRPSAYSSATKEAKPHVTERVAGCGCAGCALI